MKNERRNKRLYKTISCVVVFLVCVFAFVSLAICKASNNKVNAGVIIESSYTRNASQTQLTIRESTNNNFEFSYGIPYIQIQSIGSNGQQLCQVYNDDFSVFIGTLYIYQVRFDFSDVSIRFQKALTGTSNGTFVQKGLTIMPYNKENVDAYIIIDLTNIFAGIRSLGNNDATLNNNNYTMACSSFTLGVGGYFFQKANTIKSVNNIFDLPNNALTLLYINDVSGLNTSEMRDEITINWGYINSNDNTIYAEHAPTISAQNMQTDDKIIRLGVPLNAAGDAMDFYDISQQALLNISSLPEGSATAQAHIYGVYVWHNNNNIKWGLAEFNTQVDPVPGSALNMNYITSLTELYDFQTLDTMNMTCRLRVSSNFNFITIKNQTNGPDKDSINAVIQQGGFLPAWSVYNWARGTYSGFIAGDASARADYLEGRPGYEAIYQAGYSDGFNSAELGTANWFITSFRAVDAFLSIHIFPNITFGVLLGIPFVISVAWFIIRMFRGGGGD